MSFNPQNNPTSQGFLALLFDEDTETGKVRGLAQVHNSSRARVVFKPEGSDSTAVVF